LKEENTSSVCEGNEELYNPVSVSCIHAEEPVSRSSWQKKHREAEKAEERADKQKSTKREAKYEISSAMKQ